MDLLIRRDVVPGSFRARWRRLLWGFSSAGFESRVSARGSTASSCATRVAPLDRLGVIFKLFFALADVCGDRMRSMESDDPVSGMSLPRTDMPQIPECRLPPGPEDPSTSESKVYLQYLGEAPAQPFQ